jgi:hemolysin III
MRDPVAALTHWFGFALALLVAPLVVRVTPPGRRWPVVVFGVTLCVLYAASGLYHTPTDPYLKDVFRRIDLSAIFLLIAGSCTAILHGLHPRWWTSGILTAIWLLTAAGVGATWALPSPGYALTVTMYIALGSLGVLAAGSVLEGYDATGIFLIVAGNVCYIAGGVLDVFEWPTIVPGVFGSHEVLHVLDLFGSAFHVAVVVRRYGRRDVRPTRERGPAIARASG